MRFAIIIGLTALAACQGTHEVSDVYVDIDVIVPDDSDTPVDDTDEPVDDTAEPVTEPAVLEVAFATPVTGALWRDVVPGEQDVRLGAFTFANHDDEPVTVTEVILTILVSDTGWGAFSTSGSSTLTEAARPCRAAAPSST